PQPGGWPGSDGRILLHFYREVIGPLDWLNPQAVQALIDRSLDLHYREFGSEYGRTVRGLMLAAAQRPSPDIVPPDLSKQPASLIPHPATESAIPYSPILDAHLRHAHDRKLSEYLPAIFFETNSDDIRDYFEAIETLYAEAFVLIQR